MNGSQESMARLTIALKPDEALTTADLVVEAVTESLDLKKKLFSGYDKIAPAKVKLMSCFHEFFEYESTNFFYQFFCNICFDFL
jgi:hypothetical protein